MYLQLLMLMQIINSNIGDIDEIFRLYNIATDYQKTRYIVQWPEFERSLVETEIKESRQWKIIIDNKTACVFAITYDDPLIWEEKNADSAVYIHRIATSPEFRGRNLVTAIVEWSIKHAKKNNKQYVRLDTIGENIKLIEHYKKSGFNYLGLLKLKNTTGLPAHYDNATVSLFELEVE